MGARDGQQQQEEEEEQPEEGERYKKAVQAFKKAVNAHSSASNKVTTMLASLDKATPGGPATCGLQDRLARPGDRKLKRAIALGHRLGQVAGEPGQGLEVARRTWFRSCSSKRASATRLSGAEQGGCPHESLGKGQARPLAREERTSPVARKELASTASLTSSSRRATALRQTSPVARKSKHCRPPAVKVLSPFARVLADSAYRFVHAELAFELNSGRSFLQLLKSVAILLSHGEKTTR